MREADMAEAPARISTEDIGNDDRPPAAARRASRAGTVAVVVAALFAGANLASRPDFVSQAQIRARPVGFAEVVDRVKPAVISVRVKYDAGKSGKETSRLSKDSRSGRAFRRFGQPDTPGARSSSRGRNILTGQGSGFFISADGYAVTNFHVVERADNVEITADDGRVFAAKVIGADQNSDVALVKVDSAGNLPFVTFADSNPRVGDWVIAVGNPFGLGGTVTAGIVSARGRDIGAGPYDDFIQIDAAVNRGNSGGPTFDVDGNVIGVNSAIVSPTGGSVGIAFAIPAETVKAVVAQLKDKGMVTRGWMGVQIQPVTADIAENLGLKTAEGALVADPQPNGPAAKAGILAGDVITAVNGNAVKDARDLAKQIGGMAPGGTAKLTVWRKGEEKTFTIALGELPNQREARATTMPDSSGPEGTDVPRLGLTVVPAGQVAGSGSEGVVVTEVDPNGIASDQGVKTGDVILEVGGKKVANPADIRSALKDAQKDGKRTILMRVKSGDATKFVALRLGKA